MRPKTYIILSLVMRAEWSGVMRGRAVPMMMTSDNVMRGDTWGAGDTGDSLDTHRLTIIAIIAIANVSTLSTMFRSVNNINIVSRLEITQLLAKQSLMMELESLSPLVLTEHVLRCLGGRAPTSARHNLPDAVFCCDQVTSRGRRVHWQALGDGFV